ncbi:hypothetical protein GA0115240_105817 [Streptomyces sp. DvalAA-14]|uniref:hypothetical protein n=1 Tax=unclassified Streptomyces TaxID=2593676 RepID=UPI00081B60C2|nr:MULTISPECIES: hypothetical protein [unclassified Streptomyces]MYS19166.1 hypothetical protein [Streptomyces sp. SID4948]SCD38179.1 hypothetical protein GA0115240_105817 [Streptomyces sp. DvalAA-14]
MSVQFDPPIVAGTVLVREQIQSQDYVAGVSGWCIFANGDAEFNNGTFRGFLIAAMLATGLTGRRIVINENNDQSMSLYDDDDKLMMTIGDDAGTITSFDVDDGTHSIQFGEAMIQFMYDAGGGFLTPAASLFNVGQHILLNTQLAGGVAFDASVGALSAVVPGSNSLEQWQTPTYSSTQWMDSTTFHGGTNWGPLRIRKTESDELRFSGAFKTATTGTAPSATVLNVSVGYRPKSQQPIYVQQYNTTTAAFSSGMAMLTTAGNLNLPTPTGLSAALNCEYLINGSIPLHNLT